MASKDSVRERVANAFAAAGVDVLVAPANQPAWETDHANGDDVRVSSSVIAAASGYPSLVVPVELTGQLPLGLALIGEPFSEALLVTIAAELERIRGPFPEPKFLPTRSAADAAPAERAAFAPHAGTPRVVRYADEIRIAMRP